jgi:hypothetical protein
MIFEEINCGFQFLIDEILFRAIKDEMNSALNEVLKNYLE